MAITRIRCNLCKQPVSHHCPESNTLCNWLTCRNRECSADVYDLDRGLLRHRDGRVEGWDQAET